MAIVSDEHPGESSRARLVGWFLALVMIAHSLLIVVLPRLEKESAIREVGRGWHYALGTVLLILAIWRLWLWFKDRGGL